LVLDDTSPGLSFGDAIEAPECVRLAEHGEVPGKMRALLHLWQSACDLSRFVFDAWEIETLARWTDEPGKLIQILSEHGYLAPVGAHAFRLAGALPQQVVDESGLASVIAEIRRAASAQCPGGVL